VIVPVEGCTAGFALLDALGGQFGVVQEMAVFGDFGGVVALAVAHEVEDRWHGFFSFFLSFLDLNILYGAFFLCVGSSSFFSFYICIFLASRCVFLLSRS
jgi:hypothetical protein